MATIKTVSVNYERKLNTGNYSSATVGISLWADIELDAEGNPTENVQDVLRDLWAIAKANAKEQMIPLMNGNGGKE